MLKRVLIGALLLTMALLAACGGSDEATPEPPPTPTREIVATSEAPEGGSEAGSAWARMQSSGQMVVGTSADYPPFEFYTDEFALDGFDIALIQAIGQEMGYEVIVRDMAFDGLGDALALGQIDVAIGAISNTPERDTVIDFSNTYFVSEDAVLANGDLDLGELGSVEQLSGYKIGAQAGTVFERWLRESLVEPGLLPESNLLIYTQIDPAIGDLSEGRIELVVLDAGPAQVAQNDAELNVEIVSQGLNRERYAVAMAEGEQELRRALNEALASLQSAGYISQLTQTYLGFDEGETLPDPGPEPTPEAPVPTPVPPQCLDGMAYIQDLNYDDGNMSTPFGFPPNTPFTKGWRIQNVGTCTWDSSYALVFVSGNIPGAQMSGQPTSVRGTVAPGDTYDMFVDLVAPAQPGVYQGFWTMRNGDGQQFGAKVWVGIETVSPTQPTPVPTQPPSADVQFSADRTGINQGECATLSWTVQNVQAVYLYEDGQSWQNHGVEGQGTRRVCPAQTTTYDLRVVKRDGSIEIRQITIVVQPVNNVPLIQQFAVTPPNQVPVGECVEIQWRVSGDVTRIDLRRDGTVLWDNAPLNGVQQDCPPGPGSVLYTLNVTGGNGTAYREQRINVSQP